MIHAIRYVTMPGTNPSVASPNQSEPQILRYSASGNAFKVSVEMFRVLPLTT